MKGWVFQFGKDVLEDTVERFGAEDSRQREREREKERKRERNQSYGDEIVGSLAVEKLLS